jgi:pimeloyl-ACP methyl ester carboxylesterase
VVAEIGPQARLVVFDGSLHSPMWEESDDFNETVWAFFAETDPALGHSL